MVSSYKKSKDCQSNLSVVSRISRGNSVHLKLSNDDTMVCRRYIPIGKSDRLCEKQDNLFVLAGFDNIWIEVGQPWTKKTTWNVGDVQHEVMFKEIESEEEFKLFDSLRDFHYRGGGGIGRVVPLIAVSSTWDLPYVLGFIEISSSMIANTARRQFFDHPYREPSGLGWLKWDRAATKKYSNTIARISRFVIHPEVRGLGLARLFLMAAINYATERWHYGGYRPRFLEITADMLRFYKFVGNEFVYLGDTEGNEHRLAKDMSYLVKNALSGEGIKAMPQGGGGIMTLQRKYASRLLAYMDSSNKSLRDAIEYLQFSPEHLDQKTWEALYKLNRKPKPCYMAGLTCEAKQYLERRSHMLNKFSTNQFLKSRTTSKTFSLKDVVVSAHAKLDQSRDGRRIQDAFGFVGTSLNTHVVESTSFELESGSVTMVCGASGSGKTLLGNAIRILSDANQQESNFNHSDGELDYEISGTLEPKGRTVEMQTYDGTRNALEQLNITSFRIHV